MLKKRVVAVLIGLALLVGVVGSSGIMADSLGWRVTPQTFACGGGASGGGGC